MAGFIRVLPSVWTLLVIKLPWFQITFRQINDLVCGIRMTPKALHHCPNCRAVLLAARLARYINERCISNFGAATLADMNMKHPLSFRMVAIIAELKTTSISS